MLKYTSIQFQRNLRFANRTIFEQVTILLNCLRQEIRKITGPYCTVHSCLCCGSSMMGRNLVKHAWYTFCVQISDLPNFWTPNNSPFYHLMHAHLRLLLLEILFIPQNSWNLISVESCSVEFWLSCLWKGLKKLAALLYTLVLCTKECST
jgi:hypothetical protein